MLGLDELLAQPHHAPGVEVCVVPIAYDDGQVADLGVEDVLQGGLGDEGYAVLVLDFGEIGLAVGEYYYT